MNTNEARAMQTMEGIRIERLRLNFTLSDAPLPRLPACVLVVGVFTRYVLSPSAEAIDIATRGRLLALLKRGDLANRIGASLVFYDLPSTAARRVMTVCLGDRDSFDERAYFEALKGAGQALQSLNVREVVFTLAELEVADHPLDWRVMHATRNLADSAYRFDVAGGNGDAREDNGWRNITLIVSPAHTTDLERAVHRGAAIATGMALARDLGNLPGNIGTPAYLAETARVLADEHGFELELSERGSIAERKVLAALPAVNDSACMFIVLRHNGGGSRRPIVLVGSGITSDTNCLPTLPGEGIEWMRVGMCGAASVLGAMKVVGLLKPPLNVIGIIAAVWNPRGAGAARPGDVVVSMSGHTIEILDSNAEGALILGDALTHAQRYQPQCIVDIAALSSACTVALGSQTSGLFANDDSLAEDLFLAGMETGDRAWRLPLWPENPQRPQSRFADMASQREREAGAIATACFLSKFAEPQRWAHLEIAGTARTAEGATGRPVSLLGAFLLKRADLHGPDICEASESIARVPMTQPE